MLSNMMSTRPPSISASAGPLPRKGTWTMSIPAERLNSSAERWTEVPRPEEA
jgi:hypothetical protein